MSMFKKIGAVLMAVGVIAVIGTFVSVKSANATAGRTIRLAHNQQDGTEIADTIAKFSEFVAEDPSMDLAVQIYPSGILGSENEEIEMVQAGILDMAKVGSQTLSQFDDRYSIFAVPYLFVGQEHYYEAMEQSEEVQKLFESTADQGFIAIGYYANGSRNFYTVDDICVDDPSKLKGLKIRSMPSATSMEMITAMGGSPVPMSELALTVNGHEDLVKAYTYTEHQYSPDIYIISTALWKSMSAEQQEYLKECLARTNDNFKTLYNGMMEAAIEEAKEHGVTIYRDIDKTTLIESVSEIAEKYMSKGDNYRSLYEDIQKYADAK